MSIPIHIPGPGTGVAQPDDARPIDTSTARAMGMSPAARIEQLQHAIAVVRTLDEAKGLRDMAATFEVYAKRAVLSRDIALDAAEVRLLAEQAVGKKLLAMEKAEGGRPRKNPSCDAMGFQRLKDLGITPDQASKWQRIAGLPKETLTRYFEKSRLRGQSVTTSGAVRLAMERVDRAKRHDARQIARTRGGAASYQMGGDDRGSDGRRHEPNLGSAADRDSIAEELAIAPDEVPDCGDEDDELVEPAVAARKVEIVAGALARRPARRAPSPSAIGARDRCRSQDLDDIESANAAVSTRDGSLHQEPDPSSAPVGQQNDPAAQFRTHLQRARDLFRSLDVSGLRAAAREVESLACEISDTLQALREAEPPSIVNVGDDAVDLDYYQVGEEELP